MKEKIGKKGTAKRLFQFLLVMVLAFSGLPQNVALASNDLGGLAYETITLDFDGGFLESGTAEGVLFNAVGINDNTSSIGFRVGGSSKGTITISSKGDKNIKGIELVGEADSDKQYTTSSVGSGVLSVDNTTFTVSSIDTQTVVISLNAPTESKYVKYDSVKIYYSAPLSHTHTWEYILVGADTIKATCNVDGHTTANDVSLTLTASDANYSGNQVKASLGDTSAWTEAGLTVPNIIYIGRGGTVFDESTTAPSKVGKYTAIVTPDTKIFVQKDFEIIDANGGGNASAVNHDKSKESGNLEGSGLNNSSAELFEKVLTKEEQVAVNNGATANVWLDVKAKEAKTVSDADANKIKKAAPSGYHVSSRGYIDINIWKQIGTASATTVPNLQGKVSITVKVPAELQKSGRAYKVIRLHNDVAETLETKQDANYNLTFETDGFSTYAIAYSDAAPNAATTSPKTGETQNMLAFILLIGLCGLLGLFISKKEYSN